MTQLAVSKASARDLVQRALVRAGLISAVAEWSGLDGGRSNHAWVVRTDSDQLVCKLFASDRQTPLFPNRASDELVALRALSGTGLGPCLRGAQETPLGTALVYDFVEGRALEAPTSALAETLAKVHDHPAPEAARSLSGGSAEITRQTQALLADLSDHQHARLLNLRPTTEVPASAEACFLHGDPVPANAIETPAGVVLIDWQCPAQGDPCEDLAVALSPAMAQLYGAGAPDAATVDAFLDAYGDPNRSRRYRALAPHYHWRMAAYCLWMGAGGHADYAQAAAFELAALEKLHAQDHSG